MARGIENINMNIDMKNTIISGDSLLVRLFTITPEPAIINDAPITIHPELLIPLISGRNITNIPIKPVAMAAQRRIPAFSPRKTIAKMVEKTGVLKDRAVASVIGMMVMA